MNEAAIHTLLRAHGRRPGSRPLPSLGRPLGPCVGLLREARLPIVGHLIVLYVSLGRATPLVTLVLFFFIASPVMGFPLERYTAALITLILNTAAFNAEVWRAAIRSFPREQVEAARAAGMSRFLIFRRIMLPQILITALPVSSTK